MDPLRVAYDHDRFVRQSLPDHRRRAQSSGVEVQQTDATLSISAFARRSRLSMKALRLYERLGLLAPSEVDPSNGYRRYRESQLATARLVAMLRRLDMPLAQVADVVSAPEPRGAELITAYWDAVERRIASQRELASHLRTRLSGAEASLVLAQVHQREVPAQLVLTEQRHVHVRELATWIPAAMIRLAKSARQLGGVAGPMFAVYHGEVNDDSDGPVEVCVPVSPVQDSPTDPIMRREPAHREAYIRLTRAQVEYPQILSAFDAVAQWIDSHQLVSAGSPREVYFTNFSAAALTDEVCDVAFPFL